MTPIHIIWFTCVVIAIFSIYTFVKEYRRADHKNRQKLITVYLVVLLLTIAVGTGRRYTGLPDKVFHTEQITVEDYLEER